MNVVVSWLKDLIDFDMDADHLAHLLTQLGLEAAVGSVRRIPDGVVVGKVQSVEKHPNADKLSVCAVDPGDGSSLSIVCGAPNVRAGLTVALATIGTKLAPDFTIKKAKLRGVESQGMICSEKELGISEEHAGIMELPGDSVPGQPLTTYVPNDETIEIDLTPNRGDCLSHLGVARDLSAKLGIPLKTTARTPLEEGPPIQERISVENQAPSHCPRYTGRLITGVKIGPSPLWLRHRLAAAGLRPINNVVDITNYILLHFGHPMHAFDYNRIAGKKIIVKRAAEGETFVTLDEVSRVLSSEDLLICDTERAVALAGVMGGLNSGISDETTDVFLECAYFEPVGIRKTAKRVGLSTDSSYRFERGVDYGQGLLTALDTAAEMIREIAGGTIAKGKIDVQGEQVSPPEIPLRMKQVNRLLGIEVPQEQALGFLSALGIEQIASEKDSFTFKAPTFRHDLGIEADLIEEIGRMYGYDNIPPAQVAPIPLLRTLNPTEHTTDIVRTSLSSCGFHEIVTNSMGAPRRQALVSTTQAQLALRNPLTPDMSIMRTSLIASMLEVVGYNLNRKNRNNRLFELGKTYEAIDGQELPVERDLVCIAIEGDFFPSSWQSPAVPSSFFVLKGVVERFLAAIGVKDVGFRRLEGDAATGFNEESARVEGNRGISGRLGQIDQAVLKQFDIKTPVFCAEIDVTEFLTTTADHPLYRQLPKYPAVERDFSFIMPDELHSSEIAGAIKHTSDMVERVKVFDQYRGSPLEKGTKSVAYAVVLRSPERTLTDKDADQLCETIIEKVSKEFGISLRS